MTYVPGLGTVSRRERYLADRFYESLTGVSRRARARQYRWPSEQTEPATATAPAPAPVPVPALAQQPYLPPGAATSSRRATFSTARRIRLSSSRPRSCPNVPPTPPRRSMPRSPRPASTRRSEVRLRGPVWRRSPGSSVRRRCPNCLRDCAGRRRTSRGGDTAPTACWSHGCSFTSPAISASSPAAPPTPAKRSCSSVSDGC